MNLSDACLQSYRVHLMMLLQLAWDEPVGIGGSFVIEQRKKRSRRIVTGGVQY